MFWNDDKKDKDDTERSLLTRLFEGVLVICACSYLLRLAISYILSVKVPLIILSVIVGIIYIAIKTSHWRKRNDY